MKNKHFTCWTHYISLNFLKKKIMIVNNVSYFKLMTPHYINIKAILNLAEHHT